jgi:hypothetical protein
MGHLESYLDVKVLEPYSLLYSKLLRPVSHDEYKVAMFFILQLLHEQKLLRWLIDATASHFTMKDQRWTIETMAMLMQETTIRKIAMIRDDDVFLRVVAQRMRSEIYGLYGQLQQIDEFETTTEALVFLTPGENYQELEYQILHTHLISSHN